MKTKQLVVVALFLAIGAALDAIMPAFFFGMKPDAMLTMMFLAMLLFPSMQTVVVSSVVTGLLSGLTSTFPGGFIPNLVEKPVTAFIIALVLLTLKGMKTTLPKAIVTVALGTLVSGAIFLTIAQLLVGLPSGAGFIGLFTAVVLPATAVNSLLMAFIFPLAQQVLRRQKQQIA